jgi:hypothetical protein
MVAKMTWPTMVFVATTLCNRKCPDCCCRIPTHDCMPGEHYDWAYFERAAAALRGIDLLIVSGGEPTIHPEFPRISREFRALFDCQTMRLVSNGAKIVEHAECLSAWNQICITAFGDRQSGEAITWVNENLPGRLQVYPYNHIPMSRIGGGGACCRYDQTTYANGRLFSCCGAWGIPDAPSIALTSDWRERIDAVPRPCDRCIFSQPEASA